MRGFNHGGIVIRLAYIRTLKRLDAGAHDLVGRHLNRGGSHDSRKSDREIRQPARGRGR